MSGGNPPEISVVIGSKDASATIGACLESVCDQASGLEAEVLVVDGSTAGSLDDVNRSRFRSVTWIRSSPDLLVPELWALGISRARGMVVALTSAECVPAGDWLSSILDAFAREPRAAAVGGPVEPPDGGSGADWALYFARYSAFLPPVAMGMTTDVAGDNAAYRRADLEPCADEISHGFWETLVHRRLRERGRGVLLSPAIRVRLSRGASRRAFVAARFRHGRYYGSTRPGLSVLGRVARLAAGPALLPFLVARSAARVLGRRPDLAASYVRALPWLVVFLTAWCLGELSGYLTPRRA